MYTRLGKTDLMVSRLGLGTVKFGRNQGVKYPEHFELPSDKDARQLLTCARDAGINLIDTAPAYGASEERLGKLLRGERKEWVICTKAGEEFHPSYDSSQGQSTFDFSPQAIRLSVERSLRRLHTDYLDLVLIHSDGDDLAIIQQYQVFDTLAELKARGWIRAFGMSTKTVEGGILCAQSADVIMTTFDHECEEDHQLLAVCDQHQIGVLLKKIFNNGKLLQKPQAAGNTRDVNETIAQQMQLIFAQRAVNSAIIGTLNCQHLRNNIDCAREATANTIKTARIQ